MPVAEAMVVSRVDAIDWVVNGGGGGQLMVERVLSSAFVYATKIYRGHGNDVRLTVGIDSSELAVGNKTA